jgi:hypothetical protein
VLTQLMETGFSGWSDFLSAIFWIGPAAKLAEAADRTYVGKTARL